MTEIIRLEEGTIDDPYAELRATPAERSRLFASLKPFDCDEWQRTVTPAGPEESIAVEQFLQDREEDRRREVERARRLDG